MYAFFTSLRFLHDREAHPFGIVFLCSMMLLTGCPRAQPNNGRPSYVQVLSDFVFVGSGPYDPKSVPAHGMKELQLPSRFEAGPQYVFHLHRSNQDQDIYKILLSRLQLKGIKITSSGTVDQYIGGPGFRITFEGNGLQGGYLYQSRRADSKQRGTCQTVEPG
jgi:hypothetical protein